MAYKRFGKYYEKNNDFKSALSLYQKFKELEYQLQKDNPKVIEYKHELANAYCVLSKLYLRENNCIQAKKYFRQSNDIFIQLIKKYPSYAKIKEDYKTLMIVRDEIQKKCK